MERLSKCTPLTRFSSAAGTALGACALSIACASGGSAGPPRSVPPERAAIGTGAAASSVSTGDTPAANERAGDGLPAEGTACSVQPVSPRPSVQAQKLLCYLYSEYGRHILSGQEESTWVNGPEHEMNYIFRHTGKLPAIRGMDFGQAGVAERAITWWAAGGIPQIGYHMGAPTHPDTYEATKLAVSIKAVLTPGTAENASFLQKLDAAAGELKKLQSANVAVLWRPFHEAGGTWFWWSKEGAERYVELWRFVFDRYTKHHGLTNLVWLFPYNGEPDPAFYPGKAYVDVAGADTYAKDRGPLTAMFLETRRIVGPTLPIALHENGPIPDPNQLQSTGARWVLFNTWHTTHLMDTTLNPVAWLREVYNHEYVITRDELPDLH